MAAERAQTITEQPELLRVELQGLSVAALQWGPADGPLCLCLHGYPDTAWTWRHLGPYLAAQGWRVVAPFQRGYAPTGLASDGTYQVGALARDARQLRDALGGDERAVLVGHDWGAIAAYAATANAPGAFAKVVTMAVPAIGPLLRPSRLAAHLPLLARQLRQSWYIFFNQLPWIPERLQTRVVAGLWEVWSPGYDAREDLRHLDASLDGRARRTAALRYYRALLNPLFARREYARDQRRWTAVPAMPWLYLHGRDDGCMLADLAEATRDDLPPEGRMEIVPGTGHFLQLEDPERVNGLIAGFLGPAPQ